MELYCYVPVRRILFSCVNSRFKGQANASHKRMFLRLVESLESGRQIGSCLRSK